VVTGLLASVAVTISAWRRSGWVTPSPRPRWIVTGGRVTRQRARRGS